MRRFVWPALVLVLLTVGAYGFYIEEARIASLERRIADVESELRSKANAPTASLAPTIGDLTVVAKNLDVQDGNLRACVSYHAFSGVEKKCVLYSAGGPGPCYAEAVIGLPLPNSCRR